MAGPMKCLHETHEMDHMKGWEMSLPILILLLNDQPMILTDIRVWLILNETNEKSLKLDFVFRQQSCPKP